MQKTKLVSMMIIFIIILNILIPIVNASIEVNNTEKTIEDNSDKENEQLNEDETNKNNDKDIIEDKIDNEDNNENIEDIEQEENIEEVEEKENLEKDKNVNDQDEENAKKEELVIEEQQVNNALLQSVRASTILENGTYTIKSALNEKVVLDISGASKSNGANVQIWENSDVDQQKFNITYLGTGYYKIEAVHSQKVLDIQGAGKTNGTNVQQYDSNNSDAQQWIIQDAGNGYYNIVSKCNNLYLDIVGGSTANGTNIQVYEGNGSNAQKFKLYKKEKLVGEQTIKDGMYQIATAIKNNNVMDISNASKSNGANVQIWENNDVNQQKFNITYLGTGYYKIEAVHSQKVLDIQGAGKTNGTNVQQYDSNNSDAQQWIIKEAGNGYYNIISKCNELYLDIAGGSTANGANIQVYEGNGSNAQKFKFISTYEVIEQGTYKIASALNQKLVLDIAGGSKANDANVQIWADSDVNQQKFNITHLGSGYYKISIVHSGKVLDVQGAGTVNGTNIVQYDSNNSDAQQWLIKSVGNGFYNIISKCNNLYMDINGAIMENGTNIQMYTGNGSNAQKFKLIKTEEIINDGLYTIATALNIKSVLDIAGNSKQNNANVQIWTDSDVNQQKFDITYIGNGYYKIIAAHSGKSLDVVGAGKTNGTNVQQYDSNNSAAQQWMIKSAGNGYYYIVSRCNALYLDVSGGSSANGTNVQLYSSNGSNSQKFKLTQTTLKEENYSNFSILDESKYPGYKAALQELQNKYPNWNIQIYYTGLNWNDVINNEDIIDGGVCKSLIYDTYNNEWINGTEKYDVNGRWYRASRKAIEYMMDPRNSLTDKWIFQFQDLASSTGTRAEIEKMVSGSFLDKSSLIDTILSTAKEQNISPFHIVSRIIQEQGKNGGGDMNGYTYLGSTVYNLFNINVTGNTSLGLLAGAKYAYERGWFTQEASIKGGATFLKTNYIGRGQSTLYFQKYNVVKSPYYQNQYMQNIRAANDEGNSIYNAYSQSGILNSSFTFKIPVYENMPREACPTPR